MLLNDSVKGGHTMSSLHIFLDTQRNLLEFTLSHIGGVRWTGDRLHLGVFNLEHEGMAPFSLKPGKKFP